MTDPHEALIEKAAKAFCEASGNYRWEGTGGSVRDWYLNGMRAVLALIADETKEATSGMRNAAYVEAGYHTQLVASDAWVSMHRASALWPTQPQSTDDP